MTSVCPLVCENRGRVLGLPLPARQKAFFERGFGCSLDAIRWRVDPAATKSLDAEAFATGRHIVLRETPSNWDAPAVRYLLGHEIAHCLQQRAVVDSPHAVVLGGIDDALEHEAHRASMDLLAGRRPGPLSQETCPVIRRVPAIRPTSVHMVTTHRQEGEPKRQRHQDAAKDYFWFPAIFGAWGTAELNGGPGDAMGGYTLGWLQMMQESTNWGLWRGHRPADGSMFHPRLGATGRETHVCRDTIRAGAFLVDNVGVNPSAQFKSKRMTVPTHPTSKDSQLMAVNLRDSGGNVYALQLRNPKTNKLNFLREVDIQFDACTVLTLMHPNGRLEFLKHAYWGSRQHYTFAPPANTTLDAASDFPPAVRQVDSFTYFGPTLDGTPKLPKFARLLTESRPSQCLNYAEAQFRKQPLSDAAWKNWGVGMAS